MKTTLPSWQKSSTTLTGEIELKRSRRGLACYCLLFTALLTASLLVFLDGYPLSACAAALLALGIGVAGRQPRPIAVRSLAGRWQLLFPGRGWVEVEILPPVHRPPWLLAFRWRAPGEVGGEGAGVTRGARWLYLWPDSLTPKQWRQLRKVLPVTVSGHRQGGG